MTSKPDPVAVFGQYELIEAQSIIPERTMASRDPSRGFSVVLRADGTFSATNVPLFESDSPWQEEPRLVSASGRWKLDTVAGGNTRIWGIDFDSKPRILSACLMGGLVGRGPPYRIVFTVGDPDSGAGLTFRRKE